MKNKKRDEYYIPVRDKVETKPDVNSSEFWAGFYPKKGE